LERQTAVIQGKASGFIIMSMKTASESSALTRSYPLLLG